MLQQKRVTILPSNSQVVHYLGQQYSKHNVTCPSIGVSLTIIVLLLNLHMLLLNWVNPYLVFISFSFHEFGPIFFVIKIRTVHRSGLTKPNPQSVVISLVRIGYPTHILKAKTEPNQPSYEWLDWVEFAGCGREKTALKLNLMHNSM